MKKVLTLTVLGAVVAAGSAFAVTQDIDVFATMRVGLSFANKVDANFTPSSGHIDFYGTPDPTTDFVTLATDGTIAPVGTIFQPSALVGTPGSVDIVSDGASDVDITCTTGAVLAEPGAKTLAVDSMEISMNTGHAFAAGDYQCSGLTSVTPFAYTLTGTADKIILGGRLVGSADVVTAAYDTTQTGGTAATIKVLYH